MGLQNLKIAFLSEMHFRGKVHSNHPNMRTEMAWMCALNADHFPLQDCLYSPTPPTEEYDRTSQTFDEATEPLGQSMWGGPSSAIPEEDKVKPSFPGLEGYDHVFLIFPKGKLNLNAEGSQLGNDKLLFSPLLVSTVVSQLKKTNGKIHYIQEGPHWLFNDYDVEDQFNFLSLLSDCDSIFAHNYSDVSFYEGLLPSLPVNVIPSLLIEDSIKHITPVPANKVIIGGNLVRWYGGLQSLVASAEIKGEKWIPNSHALRQAETQISNIQHLPRLAWIDWMRVLSTFRYAIHLMPTIAAGTFSLNCAYFGIPCIGNEKVDTQRKCHPLLSIDPSDVKKARALARQLSNDIDFYNECSRISKEGYKKEYSIEHWNQHMLSCL